MAVPLGLVATAALFTTVQIFPNAPIPVAVIHTVAVVANLLPYYTPEFNAVQQHVQNPKARPSSLGPAPESVAPPIHETLNEIVEHAVTEAVGKAPDTTQTAVYDEDNEVYTILIGDGYTTVPTASYTVTTKPSPDATSTSVTTTSSVSEASVTQARVTRDDAVGEAPIFVEDIHTIIIEQVFDASSSVTTSHNVGDASGASIDSTSNIETDETINLTQGSFITTATTDDINSIPTEQSPGPASTTSTTLLATNEAPNVPTDSTPDVTHEHSVMRTAVLSYNIRKIITTLTDKVRAGSAIFTTTPSTCGSSDAPANCTSDSVVENTIASTKSATNYVLRKIITIKDRFTVESAIWTTTPSPREASDAPTNCKAEYPTRCEMPEASTSVDSVDGGSDSVQERELHQHNYPQEHNQPYPEPMQDKHDAEPEIFTIKSFAIANLLAILFIFATYPGLPVLHRWLWYYIHTATIDINDMPSGSGIHFGKTRPFSLARLLPVVFIPEIGIPVLGNNSIARFCLALGIRWSALRKVTLLKYLMFHVLCTINVYCLYIIWLNVLYPLAKYIAALILVLLWLVVFIVLNSLAIIGGVIVHNASVVFNAACTSACESWTWLYNVIDKRKYLIAWVETEVQESWNCLRCYAGSYDFGLNCISQTAEQAWEILWTYIRSAGTTAWASILSVLGAVWFAFAWLVGGVSSSVYAIQSFCRSNPSKTTQPYLRNSTTTVQSVANPSLEELERLLLLLKRIIAYVFSAGTSFRGSLLESRVNSMVRTCSVHWCPLTVRWLWRGLTIVVLTTMPTLEVLQACATWPQVAMRLIFTVVVSGATLWVLTCIHFVGSVECTQDVVIITTTILLLLFLFLRPLRPRLTAIVAAANNGLDNFGRGLRGIPATAYALYQRGLNMAQARLPLVFGRAINSGPIAQDANGPNAPRTPAQVEWDRLREEILTRPCVEPKPEVEPQMPIQDQSFVETWQQLLDTWRRRQQRLVEGVSRIGRDILVLLTNAGTVIPVLLAALREDDLVADGAEVEPITEIVDDLDPRRVSIDNSEILVVDDQSRLEEIQNSSDGVTKKESQTATNNRKPDAVSTRGLELQQQEENKAEDVTIELVRQTSPQAEVGKSQTLLSNVVEPSPASSEIVQLSKPSQNLSKQLRPTEVPTKHEKLSTAYKQLIHSSLVSPLGVVKKRTVPAQNPLVVHDAEFAVIQVQLDEAEAKRKRKHIEELRSADVTRERTRGFIERDLEIEKMKASLDKPTTGEAPTVGHSTVAQEPANAPTLYYEEVNAIIQTLKDIPFAAKVEDGSSDEDTTALLQTPPINVIKPTTLKRQATKTTDGDSGDPHDSDESNNDDRKAGKKVNEPEFPAPKKGKDAQKPKEMGVEKPAQPEVSVPKKSHVAQKPSHIASEPKEVAIEQLVKAKIAAPEKSSATYKPKDLNEEKHAQTNVKPKEDPFPLKIDDFPLPPRPTQRPATGPNSKESFNIKILDGPSLMTTMLRERAATADDAANNGGSNGDRAAPKVDIEKKLDTKSNAPQQTPKSPSGPVGGDEFEDEDDDDDSDKPNNGGAAIALSKATSQTKVFDTPVSNVLPVNGIEDTETPKHVFRPNAGVVAENTDVGMADTSQAVLSPVIPVPAPLAPVSVTLPTSASAQPNSSTRMSPTEVQDYMDMSGDQEDDGDSLDNDSLFNDSEQEFDNVSGCQNNATFLVPPKIQPQPEIAKLKRAGSPQHRDFARETEQTTNSFSRMDRARLDPGQDARDLDLLKNICNNIEADKAARWIAAEPPSGNTPLTGVPDANFVASTSVNGGNDNDVEMGGAEDHDTDSAPAFVANPVPAPVPEAEGHITHVDMGGNNKQDVTPVPTPTNAFLHSTGFGAHGNNNQGPTTGPLIGKNSNTITEIHFQNPIAPTTTTTTAQNSFSSIYGNNSDVNTTSRAAPTKFIFGSGGSYPNPFAPPPPGPVPNNNSGAEGNNNNDQSFTESIVQCLTAAANSGSDTISPAAGTVHRQSNTVAPGTIHQTTFTTTPEKIPKTQIRAVPVTTDNLTDRGVSEATKQTNGHRTSKDGKASDALSDISSPPEEEKQNPQLEHRVWNVTATSDLKATENVAEQWGHYKSNEFVTESDDELSDENEKETEEFARKDKLRRQKPPARESDKEMQQGRVQQRQEQEASNPRPDEQTKEIEEETGGMTVEDQRAKKEVLDTRKIKPTRARRLGGPLPTKSIWVSEYDTVASYSWSEKGPSVGNHSKRFHISGSSSYRSCATASTSDWCSHSRACSRLSPPTN
jgi:hypothetical protein